MTDLCHITSLQVIFILILCSVKSKGLGVVRGAASASRFHGISGKVGGKG